MKKTDFSPPTSADFLFEIKERLGLESYYKLGLYLDLSHSRISMYRNGKREFDVLTCVKVAKVLHYRLDYVLSSVEAARAKRSQEREVWQWLAHQAKKAQAAAVLVLLAIGGMGTSSDVQAAYSDSEDCAGNVYYGKWKKLVRIAINALSRPWPRCFLHQAAPSAP